MAATFPATNYLFFSFFHLGFYFSLSNHPSGNLTMSPTTLIAIFSMLISFTVTFLLTPVTIKFFKSRNWLEDPRKKQQKSGNATATGVVPRGGGLPLFLGILVSCLIFLPLDKHLIGIILAALITLIVGLIDDVKDISPIFRLGINILSALIVVAAGIGIAYISNPLGGVFDLSRPSISFFLFGSGHSIWIISDLLAVIWITWCMNIVGWSSGVDGQLSGFVAISAIFIGLLGLRYSTDTTQWPVIILSLSVAGAYLGFLPFNFFPQKIMPGYSGKSLAGFFLALLSILSGAKLATLIFLLGIPMLDAVFVLFRRLLKGHSPFSPGKDHLHHFLLKKSWSRSQIALTYWSFSLCLGILSLFLNSQQKFYFFIGIAILFFSITLKVLRRI
jgi:UDP-GlcNAc:undecaprenyl-phosphate GlcNAc-1-phosphate transferase